MCNRYPSKIPICIGMLQLDKHLIGSKSELSLIRGARNIILFQILSEEFVFLSDYVAFFL